MLPWENQAKAGCETPDFAELLDVLAQPEAFPFALARHEISLRQTHASAVLLAKDRAYKLKKPRSFGFFDYSTPALRRHFCAEEVRLNARLAPDVYLGVAPVLRLPSGQVCFGPTLPPEKLPNPGALLDGGWVLDYAVVMIRLSDEATLEAQIHAGIATSTLLMQVAQHIAAFHSTTRTDAHIASFGERQMIEGNWKENFMQTRPYIGRALDAITYEQIINAVLRFLDVRAPLFASRIHEGRIRDCHGDLRLQHVYIREGVGDTGKQFAVVDCIEFNERFRYGDVAAEIAFLTMELDAVGRPDLSRAFVAAYIQETGDETLREVLPFYACYRAYVRGKVLAFQIDEPEISAPQREAARKLAQALFALAAHYANGLNQPALLLIGGVMGTGKSTLAGALHREFGWALCSSDATRKRLAHLNPAQPEAAGFSQGVYSQDWTILTYQALLKEAKVALASGRSVLLDASFACRSHRQAATRLAARAGARAIFIECVCPPDVALQRLARRWSTRVEGRAQASAEASYASDGRPDLYAAQQAQWETFSSELEPGLTHSQVETAGALAVSVEQALEVLEIPRFACWFSSLLHQDSIRPCYER